MSRLKAVKLEHLTTVDLFRDLNERELEELDDSDDDEHRTKGQGLLSSG